MDSGNLIDHFPWHGEACVQAAPVCHFAGCNPGSTDVLPGMKSDRASCRFLQVSVFLLDLSKMSVAQYGFPSFRLSLYVNLMLILC